MSVFTAKLLFNCGRWVRCRSANKHIKSVDVHSKLPGKSQTIVRFSPLGGDSEGRKGEMLWWRDILPGEAELPPGLLPLLALPLAPIPSVRVSADWRLLRRNSRSLLEASARVSSASVALSLPCASLSCRLSWAAESCAVCARSDRFLASSWSFFSQPRASCSWDVSSRSQLRQPDSDSIRRFCVTESCSERITCEKPVWERAGKSFHSPLSWGSLWPFGFQWASVCKWKPPFLSPPLFAPPTTDGFAAQPPPSLSAPSLHPEPSAENKKVN